MNENKNKHLEFIQLVITRMNVNSFLLKGWSVTLVAALFAFAAKDTNIQYVLITYVSTPIFWFLDGYYLSQERQYRGLFNETITNSLNLVSICVLAGGFFFSSLSSSSSSEVN